MTDYIVEYSPQQGAFHIAWGLEDTIKANLSAIKGATMPEYFPVAGPFATDAEASEAIVRLRPVVRVINARHC